MGIIFKVYNVKLQRSLPEQVMTILKGEAIVLENFMFCRYGAGNKNLANMEGSLGNSISTKDFSTNSGTS